MKNDDRENHFQQSTSSQPPQGPSGSRKRKAEAAAIDIDDDDDDDDVRAPIPQKRETLVQVPILPKVTNIGLQIFVISKLSVFLK
jgi:hypothetical protein